MAPPASRNAVMSASNILLKERECYWIPHPSKVYVMVMIRRIDGDRCLVTTVEDKKDLELDIYYPFFPINSFVVDDMTALPNLHEAGILHNLEERSKLQHQNPYTYVSNVLVAVNPLRKVGEPAMDVYKDKPLVACAPHPYGIAEMAYRQLILPKSDSRNQSIVISGESGAGKTETAKIVLRYLCWRTGAVASGGSSSTGGSGSGGSSTMSAMVLKNTPLSAAAGGGGESAYGRVPPTPSSRRRAEHAPLDKRLMDTNPILEAFGNAKTLRNDNSSRFGKLLKLHLDPNHNFSLHSASLETYLLEKSRVVSVAEGERNFHVFYQVLAGAPDKKRWRLKDMESYKYIMQSSETELEDVDDAENFHGLCNSLISIGVTHAEQDIIFRVISAVLALGNIDFHGEDTISDGEVAAIDESYTVDLAASLLGVRRETLEFVLLHRNLNVAAEGVEKLMEPGSEPRKRGSQYVIKRDVMMASYARDSMAKAIYQRIFDLVIRKVGESLQANVPAVSSLPYIGVLDIFGFESFEVNRLEQLLINFANESLQMTFNKAVLASEHAIYKEEGFKTVDIVVNTHSPCLDLIAASPNSIFNILDSVCKGPNPTEERFNATIHRDHKDNPECPRPHPKDLKNTFNIRHYAQTVQYTVGNFISKNTDSPLSELDELLGSSGFATGVCPSLFRPPVSVISREDSTEFFGADADDGSGGVKGSILKSLGKVRQRTSLIAAGGAGEVAPSPRTKKKSPTTVSSIFAWQMGQLCDVLDATSCSFIRCVKPNRNMVVGVFEPRYVVEQLRSLGVIQTCEVLRLSMPTRITYSSLESMYRPFLPPNVQQSLQCLDSKRFAVALLWACNVPKEAFALGTTRLFFRTGCIQYLNQLTSMDMNVTPQRVMLSGRLIKYVVQDRWHRAFSKVGVCLYVIRLYEYCKERLQAALTLQMYWRAYAVSPEYMRRKLFRRMWRIAIIRVLFQNNFLKDYMLIKESTIIRQANEKRAAEDMQTLEREEQKRREDAEGAFRAMTNRRKSLDQATVVDISQGISPSDVEVDTIENQSALVAIDAQDQAKMKSEMHMFVAASNLATVSVCLFRWTRIKLFRAFETWMQIIQEDDVEDDLDGLEGSETVELSAELMDDSSRCASPTAERNSIVHEGESPMASRGRTSSAAGELPMVTRGRTSSTSSSYGMNAPPQQAVGGVLALKIEPFNTESVSVNRTQRSGSRGSEGEMGDDEHDVMEPYETTDDNGNPVKMMYCKSVDSCFECAASTQVHWCGSCQQMYCKLCAQIVHSSCRIMRSHKIQNVSFKGVDTDTIDIRQSFVGDARRMSLASQNGALFLDEPAEDADQDPNYSKSAGDLMVRLNTKNKQRRRSSAGQGMTDFLPKHKLKAKGAMSMTRGGDDKKKDPCSIKSCDQEARKGVSIRFCDFHYEEFRTTMKIGADSEEQKTLQQQVALLTRQLKESGQQPVEFVELSVAREKMQGAVQKLMEGDESAEKDIERWDKAIKMNPEYQKEMEEKAAKWNEDQRPKNDSCRKRMRELIPADVTQTNVQKMIEEGVPKTLANRIWSKKALWLICMHIDDIKRIHIVDLKTKYNAQGMDIVELRALFSSLPTEFDLDGDGKKAEWRNNLRLKLEELSMKEDGNRLNPQEKRNVAYKGLDDVVIYDPSVAIERREIQKSNPFGASEKAEDIVAQSGGIKNIRGLITDKPKAPICEGLLYVTDMSAGSGGVDGKKIFISLQSSLKDRGRVILGFENESDAREYTAVHSSGDADAEAKCPIKPVLEIQLQHNFGVKQGKGSARFDIFELIVAPSADGDSPTPDEAAEERLVQTFEGERARWLPVLTDALKVVKDNYKPKKSRKSVVTEAPVSDASDAPSRPAGGNPMMEAIAGRGGGGNPLMAALAGRGRGGAGRGGEGGGNPLMAAIAGRGRGGAGRGDESGGNPLMAAIAGRGRGGGDGGRGGGNPLMAAIAGRGRGGAGRGDGAGGGNPLLAAIAGHGNAGGRSGGKSGNV